ncbi:hypothetical protein [Bradyrhizobium sp. SZCCHNR1098]|uniref:hypothetical protein n=1 Tax=Bradyrhizobium sp. SZCCHNR1098 TaxID=3057370 RepID=UPI0029163B86|nr:hypothetical protein [Bradyrhizobium sp. SZCCHNR1098]
MSTITGAAEFTFQKSKLGHSLSRPTGTLPLDLRNHQTAAPGSRFALHSQADHPYPDLPKKIFHFRFIRIHD